MLNNAALSRKYFPLITTTAVALVSTVMVMMGPLLVPLAADLHTSVAVAGQLATVTSLIWGFAAIPVGPISDRYGRKRVLLTGLVLMSLCLSVAAFAASYGFMFAARVMSGLAAAMIPPTCYAAIGDMEASVYTSRVMGWTIAGGMLGAALGMPMISWLATLGSWRTPFTELGIVAGLTAIVVWAVFPPSAPSTAQGKSLISYYADASAKGSLFWLLLTVNFLMQAGSWGIVSYLPAYLMQTYHQPMGGITLPLVLNGLGVMCGALTGGRMAANAHRGIIVISAFVAGGILFAVAFSIPLSLWATVTMTAIAGGLFILSQPLNLTMVVALAGEARGTAAGMFALSTQIGAMTGAALGGALLTLGGFGYVGVGCLMMGVAAAIVMARAIRAGREGRDEPRP